MNCPRNLGQFTMAGVSLYNKARYLGNELCFCSIYI